jgi:hypothetical protein
MALVVDVGLPDIRDVVDLGLVVRRELIRCLRARDAGS